jgi:hypothetical protein
MPDENVTKDDALIRSIDNFVMEQGSLYESYIRPKLADLARRIIEDLPTMGWEITKTKK